MLDPFAMLLAAALMAAALKVAGAFASTAVVRMVGEGIAHRRLLDHGRGLDVPLL